MSSNIKYHAGDPIYVPGSEFTDVSYIIKASRDRYNILFYYFDNNKLVGLLRYDGTIIDSVIDSYKAR